MSQTHLLELLVKLLLIIAFARVAVLLLPAWILIIIAILLISASGILDPSLIQSVSKSSAPLADVLLPFLFLLLAFAIIVKGFKKK